MAHRFSYHPYMHTRLPFSALLSQAYVAFAIEFDNEFEHSVPHRTTRYGATPGYPKAPYLVSMAMWIRFMRHIPINGITLPELQAGLAVSNKSLKTWLTRLGKWWGYLRLEEPDATASWDRMGRLTIIRPTEGGKKAIEMWQTLMPTIEGRWRERFGESTLDALQLR